MNGVHELLSVKLKNMYPKLITTHCVALRLNLVVKELIHYFPELEIIKKNIKSLVAFMNSSKRIFYSKIFKKMMKRDNL